MGKTCGKCGLSKSSSCFHKQLRNKDGLQSVCKECRRQIDKVWYESNPVKKIGNKEYTKKIALELKVYKESQGCKYCFEKVGAALDFHHIDGNKEFNIMSGHQYGRERLLKEIAKCEVVCSNCHRKIHAGMQWNVETGWQN